MPIRTFTFAGLAASVLYLSSLSAPLWWSAGVQADEAPSYQPPAVGAPNRRVGGGTRGAGDTAPMLAVLAPRSTGHTLQEQPTLYWSISSAVTLPIEILLVEANPSTSADAPPLLEKTISVNGAGVHALSLQEYGVKLQPNTEYEWFVALVRNPDKRNQDIVSSGVLKRVTAETKTTDCLQQAAKQPKYSAYASCGLWYDAIADLSAAITQHPDDPALRDARAGLLAQEDLPQVAALDKQ